MAHHLTDDEGNICRSLTDRLGSQGPCLPALIEERALSP